MVVGQELMALLMDIRKCTKLLMAIFRIGRLGIWLTQLKQLSRGGSRCFEKARKGWKASTVATYPAVGRMSKPTYRILRDLHLYFGLFISPFVLVFSISVFFLVHAWMPAGDSQSIKRVVPDLPLPVNVDQLSVRPLID